MTTVVLLPDGSEKKATFIGEGIVICSDGTSYYWNEYSSVTDTVTVIDVNSQTNIENIPKQNIGIISSVSFSIDDTEYSSNKASSKVYSIGGSGSSAYFSMSTDYFNQYQLSGYSIISGGTDYISGDNIFLSPLNSMTVSGVSSITHNTITKYTANLSNSILYSSISETVSPSGGTGSNSIFTLDINEAQSYIISEIDIDEAGTGYESNDVVSIGSEASALISSVDYGTKAITKIDITLPTTLYDSPNDNIGSSYDQSGSGTGATFTVSYEELYTPNSITLSNGGYGYKVGDILTIPNVATITVSGTTTSDGNILSCNITPSTSLTLTEPSTFNVSSTGGTGYGATFTVSITNSKTYTISGYTVLDGGYGYKVGDAIKIPNILSGNVLTVEDGGIGTISSTTISYTFASIPENQLSYSVITGSGESYELESVITSATYTSLNYINELTIDVAGENYVIGDVVYLEGATTIGYLTVEGISSTGGITSFISEFNGNPLPTTTTSYNIIGGSGTGATCTITYTNTSNQIGYTITGFTIIKEGYGFEKGDTIAVSYNNNVISTITVSTVLLSTITSISYTEIGSYSTSDIDGIYTLTGGSGNGATIQLTSNVLDKIILSSVDMENSGYGYTVGDLLTIGSYGTATVIAVASDPKTITSITATIDSTTSETNMASTNVTATGGSGSSATFNVVSDTVYKVSSSVLASGGTGYNVGDYIIIDGYYDTSTKTTYSDGGYGNVEEIAAAAQDVTGISIKSSSHVTTKLTNPVTVTGGSGSGLTVNVTYSDVDSYNASGVNLTYGGFGYSVGDILNLGNGLGTVTVDAVGDLGGTVYSLQYNINSDTSNSPTDLTGVYGATGGSGTGLEIKVSYEPVPYFKISGIELLYGGYGYKVGDILSVNGKNVSVTGIKNIIST